MICDLCDKYQQNICERTFHFIKPINECLMRKAQENRKIIEELEKIKSEILFSEIDNIEWITYSNALKHCCEIIDNHISELKGENK